MHLVRLVWMDVSLDYEMKKPDLDCAQHRGCTSYEALCTQVVAIQAMYSAHRAKMCVLLLLLFERVLLSIEQVRFQERIPRER